ncbi:penicillin-binding protein [Deinococcus cellulosilyticus]|uniref:Uncharacterized protein n=1 Tax=Deinococcus cellulosilyticus (strain DSM 18568 / NBRC 106333 / KACC 11606 / 5516J-15) TaxID=1223518 RepID=A0A511N7M2_DEIC1|nr:penicillin-binding protein [Deinococcus cellulosilyticus]GEM48839.1 hypothetical protein DC3_44740 [Deinococcus cellulosilyticus NBRC 106333 = KACC 11606]
MRKWIQTCLIAVGLLGIASATPKLGNPVPALNLKGALPERYLVALYSHDCGDISDLWKEVLSLRLPVLAVNAEGVPTPAPAETLLIQGETATSFSRAAKVTVYPTLILVEEGQIVGVWEPDGTGIPEALGLKSVQ